MLLSPELMTEVQRLPDLQQRAIAVRHGLRTIPYLSEFLTDGRFPVFSDVPGKFGPDLAPEDIAQAVMVVGICGLLQLTPHSDNERALTAESLLSHVLNRLYLDADSGPSAAWFREAADAVRSLTRLGVKKSDPKSTISIAQRVLSKTKTSEWEASSELQNDIKTIGREQEAISIFDLPLWSDEFGSNEAVYLWKSDKEQYLERNPNWAFWVRWYDGLLLGKPLNWELQSRIASKLVSGGLRSVEDAAGLIKEAQYEFISEKTAVSATPVFDEASGRFRLEDRAFLHEGIVKFVINRTKDALDNAIHLSSDNSFRSASYEALALTRILERSQIDPSDAALTFVEVRHSLENKMRSGEYPRDPAVIALSNQLFIGKEELCDYDEIVRSRCERLEKLVGPRELSEDTVLILGELEDRTKEIVDDEFSNKIREAVEAVGNTEVPQKSETAKLTHWVTSMQIEIGKAIRKGDNSLAYKAAKLADFLGKVAQKLIDLWPF